MDLAFDYNYWYSAFEYICITLIVMIAFNYILPINNKTIKHIMNTTILAISGIAVMIYINVFVGQSFKYVGDLSGETLAIFTYLILIGMLILCRQNIVYIIGTTTSMFCLIITSFQVI